jgi:TRAP-type uncharacterized transport system substrate-binding protein
MSLLHLSPLHPRGSEAHIHARIDPQFFRTRTGVVLLLATAVVLLSAIFAALRPFPGRHLAIATGPPGDTYARIGQSYREILARNGVQLQLVPTNGAVDNVRLLTDPHSGIDVGFVQAGLEQTLPRDLVSLGTLFYEPVWLFCRCPNLSVSLREGPSLRISIGPVGSADRVVALKLLALNGISPQQLQLFAYPPEDAARSLLAGELDAVALSTGWDSPVVQRLARTRDISLIGFPRADAYVALVPTFSKLVLPRGVADLADDRPPQDTPLIASKASLVVRRDLHPAMQYLLLQAAMEVHSRPGMFQRAGEFPAAEEIDLPLSEEARHLYRAGPSFLQRSLPFWLAELVQRILILVVPIASIIYPLWSLVPRIYQGRMQRRVFRMYGELKLLELELRNAAPETRDCLIDRLDDLDRRALNLRVPIAFTEGSYNLKAHIRALRAWALANLPSR